MTLDEQEKTQENELNTESTVKDSSETPKQKTTKKGKKKNKDQKNGILSEPVSTTNNNNQTQSKKKNSNAEKKKQSEKNTNNDTNSKKDEKVNEDQNNSKENQQNNDQNIIQNEDQKVEEKSEKEVENIVDEKTVENVKKNEEDTTKQNNKEDSNPSDNNTFTTETSTALEPISISRKIFRVIENIIFILITLAVLAFTVFTITNTDNSTISSGISILGVDVSGLDRVAATDKISAHIKDSLENDVILKHNDYETNIGPEQLETKFDVENAVNLAFSIGSGNNIFSNGYKKVKLIFKPVDIEPELSINQDQLATSLSVISTQLPDAVIQSDYYIDGKTLVVTAGRDGVVVNIPTMQTVITEQLSNLSYINNPIEIATISQTPDKVDIEKLYTEIHKEAVDAHYDPETHIVYPEENGLDFDISLEEAKAKIAEIPQECNIPLKTLYPNVTTNMIGMEAFPDLLGSFSTHYPASNRGRTTNLKLAASKVDGTVVLPGETFSYNSIVGERTIAAGYKEAAIYQDGQVVQGLGGGVCQISSTLYNAALYANLEIVERRNHQFVPSYVSAGRDATVVYGSQDFKFKNNRKYAIKITCSVEGGVASFEIHGLFEENEYDVTISSSITSRNANSFTSATYKTLRLNGEVVSSETVSRDTYKSH